MQLGGARPGFRMESSDSEGDIQHYGGGGDSGGSSSGTPSVEIESTDDGLASATTEAEQEMEDAFAQLSASTGIFGAGFLTDSPAHAHSSKFVEMLYRLFSDLSLQVTKLLLMESALTEMTMDGAADHEFAYLRVVLSSATTCCALCRANFDDTEA